MIADQTDKQNWVLSEFLNAMKQPNIPYYPLVLGSQGGKVVELPAQLSLPAILPADGKEKFIGALEDAVQSGS